MVWRSDLSLFTSALDTLPCAPIAHRNLSAYYYQQKDNEKGREEYNKYLSCVGFFQKQYAELRNKIKK